MTTNGGCGNAILRKLSKNPYNPDDIDAEARDVAICVERYWGDLSIKVLEKATEIARERAKR